MPFVARSPTFNLSVIIRRWDAGLGAYVNDAAPTPAQLWGPAKITTQVWVADYYYYRPNDDYQSETGNMQTIWLFPMSTGPRDVFDLSPPNRDIIIYDHPHYGIRHYWADRVEPRWAGFPNEHVWCLAARFMPAKQLDFRA